MKRFSLILMAAASILASCGGNKGAEAPTEEPKAKEALPIVKVEEPVLDITTTMGTIRVKLYKETPLHRDNFMRLVSERFYDDILFHRVIKDFMIQAGDPWTKDPNASPKVYGQGGPGYTIPAEIVEGFRHKKGALAAARKGDAANPARESSGSQFYLVANEEVCAQLDGDYTIFGETVEGLDVIDKISKVATGAKDLPVEPVKILSITQVVDQPEAAPAE